MPARKQRLSVLGVTLVSVCVVVGLIGCAKPCGAQDEDLSALLDSLTVEDLAALIRQSEADSLTIKELEIRLFWANERIEIAKSGQPNWIERFMAKYGFAIGAAAGVYVGAAAVN
jgi:hypothetical protein